MEFFVNTNCQPFCINIDLQVNNNDILIVGADAAKENTEYFNRLCLKNDIFEFNLPKSPNLLKIIIFEANEGFTKSSLKYKINNVEVKNLKLKPLLVDADTKEFIDFAQAFCGFCGYSNPGTYYSANKKFRIDYFADIEENNTTPSRIHKSSGIIEVSKKWFDGMTIPGRMAILMHEFAHNHMQNDYITDNEEIEKQADENALQLYIGVGYPKVEWEYAWLHIFRNNQKHIDRLDNIYGKLQTL
jgi:hypothetical protein